MYPMKGFNKTAVAIAIVALTAGSAMAQPREGKPEKMAAYKELFGSLKTWAQSNVLPQLRTWKSKLDGAMSQEDLAKLNDLRARAAQLRKDAMATGMAMRKAWKDENYDALKQNRDKMKSFAEERKAIFQDLKPLAVKYRSTLEAIGTEAKPKIESWKKEGKDIAQKWMQDHKDQLGDNAHPRMGHMGHMGGMMGLNSEMGRKMAAARFMLWDGNDLTGQMQNFNGGGAVPELK
jgi:hypothetical protein